jgi:glycerol-3-phosphate dehydrogenase (NAD(P)+)
LIKTVTILGAGVMGSSMAMPLCDTGKHVRLVGTHLDVAIIDNIKQSGRHPKLNITMPKGIAAFRHQDFGKALGDDTDLILLGVSSAGVDWAIDQLAAVLKGPTPIIMITKGMKPMPHNMGALPDHVAEQLRTRLGFSVPVAAIGGPCIAGELAARRSTGTVIVSRDMGLATRLASEFAGDYYFPQASLDMMGVEVCAAFKNFFAITVGWAHGRNAVMAEAENKAGNNNAAAILFDQAIREMMVLARALGGSAESVWGMPGAGDLYVTCQAGRNSRLGHALGRGLTYAEAMAGPLKGETVEGAELGLAVAGSIHAMVDSGAVKAERLPLALALINTLKNNVPFDPPWQRFHCG